MSLRFTVISAMILAATNGFLLGNTPDSIGGMGMVGVSALNHPRPRDKPTTESFIQTLKPLPNTVLYQTTPSSSITTPIDEEKSKCDLMYRPHPTNPRMFEVSSSPGQFEGEFQSCALSLVWNQDTCVCDWPKVEVKFDPFCGERRAHPDTQKPWLYQELVHNTWTDRSCSLFIRGLWTNDGCKCLYGAEILDLTNIDIKITDNQPKSAARCVVVSNITMDERVEDHSGNHISLPKNAQIKIVRVRGSVGRAAFIRRSSIELDAFTSNDLTDTVRFAFNFKIHHHSLKTERQMTILTNKCRAQKRRQQPSLELKFKPSDQSFVLEMATMKRRFLEKFTARKDNYGWYKVIIYLQNEVATVIVNGKKVLVVKEVKGPLRERPCKLRLAGSPFDAREYFDGYFDEFLSIKQCKCNCMNGPNANLEE